MSRPHTQAVTRVSAFIAVVLTILMAALPNIGLAQAPRTMSYQGIISGPKITGERTLSVTLYSDPDGASKLWHGTYTTTVDSTGVFNVLLGTPDNPLPQPQALDHPIYIGLSVDGTAELTPRAQLTASAYALNVADNAITSSKIADNAVTTQKVAGNAISTEQIADNTITSRKIADDAVSTSKIGDSAVTTKKLANEAVTSDKLAVDYVSAISVNGQKVTGKGTPLNIMGDVTYDALANSIVLNTSGTVNDKGAKAQWIGIGGTSHGSTCTTNSDGTPAGGTTNNVVVGGCGNRIYDTTITGTYTGPYDFCVIGGGRNNAITNRTNVGSNPPGEFNNFHFIGGGEMNIIITDIKASTENGALGHGSIVGGQGNVLVGPAWGFIGGGQSNIISNQWPTIDDDGGDLMEWDAIVGGFNNTIDTVSSYSFIGGGWGNHIAGAGTNNIPFTVTSRADRSTIAGGFFNQIFSGTDATIGGGNNNAITKDGATIAGGFTNTASGSLSSVLGGDNNTASGDGATIGGGTHNTASGQASTISGGNTNKAGRLTFVGGGFMNDATGIVTLTPHIDNSAILGGSSLFTSGQDQAVMGCMNFPMGHDHQTFSPGAFNDDRVLEVGSPKFVNGNWVQNNAFEVSFNGHSIVTQTNGSSIAGAGGQPSVFQGATYIESPVYAWGAVDATGAAIGTENFGISQVIPLWPTYTALPGTYLVTLAPADPHGGPPPDIWQASITVTVLNNNTSDIVALPAPPPMAMAPSAPQPTPQKVPDAVILSHGGSLSPAVQPTAATDPAIDSVMTQYALGGSIPWLNSSATCGYATASQIGVLSTLPGAGTSFDRSFIVRTYWIGDATHDNECAQRALPFFFKVCHR